MEIKSRVTRFAGLLCIAGALQGFPVIYSANPGGIISVARQGTYHLTGTIVDGYGEPVIGANVVEKGTTNGTVTDIDGKFSLEVAPYAVLTISFIGYISKEITLKGEKELKVVLVEDMQKLDEVVVVGYGTQRRSLVTNAISQFKPTEENMRSVMSPSELLQGRIAGVSISTSSGNLGSAEKMSIRGSSSLSASNEPLYVIDGIPLSNNSASLYSFGENMSSLATLNLTDIESIEVLKDAASAAIYGSRATNGVVLITTKKAKEGQTLVNINTSFGFKKVVAVSYTHLTLPTIA